MNRNVNTFLMYIDVGLKKIVFEMAEKRGISASKILIEAFDYVTRNDPNRFGEELSKKFIGLKEELEAKERERDTGDFIGSSKKERKKLKDIDEWEKKEIANGKDPEETRRLASVMRKDAKRNYTVTREAKKQRLLARDEHYRKELEKKKKTKQKIQLNVEKAIYLHKHGWSKKQVFEWLDEHFKLAGNKKKAKELFEKLLK